jgi:hypothetical protein
MTKTVRKRREGKTCGGEWYNNIDDFTSSIGQNKCSEKKIDFKNAYLENPDYTCEMVWDEERYEWVLSSSEATIMCDKHELQREYTLWKEGPFSIANTFVRPIDMAKNAAVYAPFKLIKKGMSAWESKQNAKLISKGEMSNDPYVYPRMESPVEGYSVISYNLIVRELHSKSKGFNNELEEQVRRGFEIIQEDKIHKEDELKNELKKRLKEEYGFGFASIFEKIQELKEKNISCDAMCIKKSDEFRASLEFINNYADGFFNKRNYYVYCDDKGYRGDKKNSKLHRLYARKLVNYYTGKKQPIIMFWIDGITPNTDCIPIYKVPTPILVPNNNPPSNGGKSKKKLTFKQNVSRKFRQTRRNLHR